MMVAWAAPISCPRRSLCWDEAPVRQRYQRIPPLQYEAVNYQVIIIIKSRSPNRIDQRWLSAPVLAFLNLIICR